VAAHLRISSISLQCKTKELIAGCAVIQVKPRHEKAIPPEKLNEAMALFTGPPSGTYYKG
jgi:hypothetical protein